MSYFWFYVGLFFAIGAVMALRVVWVAWFDGDGAGCDRAVPPLGQAVSSGRVGSDVAPGDDVPRGAAGSASVESRESVHFASGGVRSQSGEAGSWS